MKTYSLKTQLALSVSALMLVGSFSTASFAQENGMDVVDEIISTGTRRKARSAADTPAPVDVISGAEFTNSGTSEIGDLLRTVVPSYNVSAHPIDDASTIVRPANLRGLSPDNTLVLLNGKRRHRSSIIAFAGGGGISDGAQGVDVGVMPALGLKQVEVLRDGASSQYGSDAIAGVMNFILKDASEGGSVEVKYGSTYAGDGDNYRISGNIGLPLGEAGFVNITAEYGAADGTSRSVQRSDAAGLIAAGISAVGDISVNTVSTDAVQYWGQPDVKDDYKIFINSGIELSENVEAYAFGNYGERTVEGGFFFRNPYTPGNQRGGVFAGPTVDPLTGAPLASADGGVPSVRVATLQGGNATTCPRGIPINGVVPDATIMAAVAANPLCFSFTEMFPGGFVPRFGGTNSDKSIVGGFRGELDFGTGLGYDVSASYGNNNTVFSINNTINASLGPDTPTSFTPGEYTQTETGLNLDLTYGVPMEGWASDLGIAAGFEYRKEEFDITAGDPASFQLGSLAAPYNAAAGTGVEGFPTGQGFSSSSNGFGGFTTDIASSQSNIAIYGELEGDISDELTLQAAIRWEDFDSFGTTTNWKIAGLYKLSDSMRIRGTYSTGFHAPTGGQVNATNVSTSFSDAGLLQDRGTIPLSSAPGQLAANFLASTGVRPELGPETAKNMSMGVAFDTGPMTWTVDYYNIKVKDRIALTDNLNFIDVLNFAGTGVAGYDNTTIASALESLGSAGAINRSDFNGSEDLQAFRFFTNNFDTKTQGIDVVGRMPFDLGEGNSSVALALNYNSTKVTNSGRVLPLGQNRRDNLEASLPKWKGNLMFNHEQGIWRGLARVNYHSSWLDVNSPPSRPNQKMSSMFTLDLEAGAKVMENVEVIVGVANAFDSYPNENLTATRIGQKYASQAPFGFNGGSYYTKLRVNF